MALVLKETISLTTPQGVSKVQLLFGDITKLPMEEKVDAIFVSSFPANYASCPSTLIAALKRHLGIVVGDLAKNKEVSLLQRFNCWVSKPLPEDVPFCRLVCFERMNKSEKIEEQISGVFRAMMPVFNNQDSSVITPLLAAGKQGHSNEHVLKSIVTAACHWIKAGLPLRCLKIVVYVTDTRAPSELDKKLFQQFLQYKKKWEKKTSQQVDLQKKKYDVCMSYAEGDESMVDKICSGLRKVDSNIVIYSTRFTYNHHDVWQEQIFNVMVNSRRIIAVLTPKYVDTEECLDQFNLALCCNRLSGSDVLAPFYIQTISSFPSYMTVIQYTECRVRKEGEESDKKIYFACSLLVKDLDRVVPEPQASTSVKAQAPVEDEDTVYEIFISYAHRTPTEANLLYRALQDVDPNVKVFFDRSELRTGNIWQEALYSAVDGARIVVAFISQSYLQSTVCQEEFSIALARFLTEDGLFLIPVLIEDIRDVPSSFTLTQLVDMRDPAVKETSLFHAYCNLAQILIGYLQEKGLHNQFCKPSEKVDMISILDQWRQHVFKERFDADENGIIKVKSGPQISRNLNSSSVKSPKTVALSFTNDCLNQATTLCELLRKQNVPAITVEFLTSQDLSGAQASKLQLLDTADMVVVFLSDNYMASVQHRSELHIALCRQRVTKERRVLYLIQAHHTKPTPVYPHLLPHSINLGDKQWFTLARNARKHKSTESLRVQLPDGMKMFVYCSGVEYMALQTAAIDIADKMVSSGADGDSGIPTNIINLATAIRLGETGTEPVKKCLVPFSALSHKMAKSAEFVSREEHNTRYLEEARKQAELLAQLEECFESNPSPKKSSACQVL